MAIRIHLVHHHRAILASVPSEIALPIALHIQATDCDPSCAGCFQMAVWTLWPLHATSRGSPTLTDRSCAIKMPPWAA